MGALLDDINPCLANYILAAAPMVVEPTVDLTTEAAVPEAIAASTTTEPPVVLPLYVWFPFTEAEATANLVASPPGPLFI